VIARVAARAGKFAAACAAAALAAFVFHAWLNPRDPSLWLGAWITGLCT